MALTRRSFLDAAVKACASGALGLSGSRAPAIIQSDSARPATPQGVASGDVTAGRAVIWSRADRPSRLVVEYSTTESFKDVRRRIGPAALESTDFTAKLVLTDLPADQRIL